MSCSFLNVRPSPAASRRHVSNIHAVFRIPLKPPVRPPSCLARRTWIFFGLRILLDHLERIIVVRTRGTTAKEGDVIGDALPRQAVGSAAGRNLCCLDFLWKHAGRAEARECESHLQVSRLCHICKRAECRGLNAETTPEPGCAGHTPLPSAPPSILVNCARCPSCVPCGDRTIVQSR